MQAVLLMAGKNVRFFPLDTSGQKAMFRLYGRPITEYVIDDLRACGIKKFIIVVRKEDDQIAPYFGDGSRFGATIEYVFQEGLEGQGQALLQAIDLIKEEFIIPNSYHILEKDLFRAVIDRFNNEKLDGLIPGIHEENIGEYGAFRLEGDRIKGIVEKPKKGAEPSHFRSTSAYIFKPDFLKYLKNHADDEFAYEAAISDYVREKNVRMHEIDKERFMPTLKYPRHLLELRDKLSRTIKGYIHPEAQIAKSAIIESSAYIDEGAKIMDGAHIKGHSYIGKNTLIGDYAIIRNSDIGADTQIGVRADVARSIIMEGVHFHGEGFIGDSIIGPGTKIGAGFLTANKRMNREGHSQGVICGKEVSIGIRVSTMPGVLIGEKATIWPSATVYKDIPHSGTLKQEK